MARVSGRMIFDAASLQSKEGRRSGSDRSPQGIFIRHDRSPTHWIYGVQVRVERALAVITVADTLQTETGRSSGTDRRFDAVGRSDLGLRIVFRFRSDTSYVLFTTDGSRHRNDAAKSSKSWSICVSNLWNGIVKGSISTGSKEEPRTDMSVLPAKDKGVATTIDTSLMPAFWWKEAWSRDKALHHRSDLVCLCPELE